MTGWSCGLCPTLSPEKKTLKNRLHLDITVSGGRANPIETRRRLVDAEARRLEALGATLVRALFEDGLDHYGTAMRDLTQYSHSDGRVLSAV